MHTNQHWKKKLTQNKVKCKLHVGIGTISNLREKSAERVHI
jgi:hypothetical protein